MEPNEVKLGMSVYHTGNHTANIIIGKDITYREASGHYLVNVIAQNGARYAAYVDLLVPYNCIEHRDISRRF